MSNKDQPKPDIAGPIEPWIRDAYRDIESMRGVFTSSELNASDPAYASGEFFDRVIEPARQELADRIEDFCRKHPDGR